MSIITVLNLILISFVSLILIIYLIILKRPGKLSHLPSKSIFQCLKCMFSNEPRDVKHKAFIQKDLNKYKLLTLFEYGAWEIIVNCPKTARMILNDTVNFPKEIPMDNFPNSLFAKYMGKNIVYSNGDDWKKYRKIGQRVFKKKFSTSLFHSIILNFVKKVEQTNRSINTSVDVYKYMQKITMDSLGKGIMGVDFNSVENEKVDFIAAYNQIIRESLNPFYLLFSIFDTPRNLFRNSSYQCLYLIENYFSKILTEKRNKIIRDNNSMEDNSDDDILTLMIKANLNNEILFSDKEIRDNIMIYILAGHDTTSFILSATLHYLAQNPDIQEKARKEVMEVMELKKYNNCKEINEIQFPNSEQVKGMKYLLAIIKETIRLYPPVPRLTTRINKKEFKVNGFHIPKDCSINLDLFYIHRDNDNFKDADKFIPERFLNEKDNEKNISNSAYFSSENDNFFGFGGGSKFCIGNFFSILEQKLVLSTLLTRYSISYPPNSPQANGAPLLLTSNFLLLTKDLHLNFKPLS